jgi:branched-chain amino acid transport system permease protein
MEFFIISMLNGLSYGLLLFMLSSGLTLIFSMMGVLNFAHASFYMVGAYVGYTVSQVVGFWPALVIAPLIVGALGALFERICLRRVHKFGHVPELLITFGLSYVLLELVQLIWGRIALEFHPPAVLQGPAFTLINHTANGLSVMWGAAPVHRRRCCHSCGLFAVSSYARLHDACGADHAGLGVVVVDAHPHWPGDSGGADAP